ncbi:MAG: SGNH/GDSL hydrolase family protein [Bacteroidales bacterium]
MKKLSRNNFIKKFLFAAILFISIAAIYYVHKIKFYGNFSLEIISPEKISNQIKIYGHSFTNRIEEIPEFDNRFVNDPSWYFIKIEIIGIESKDINNIQIKFKNDKIEQKLQILKNKNRYFLSYPDQENIFNKLLNNVFISSTIFKFIISIILILLLSFILLRLQPLVKKYFQIFYMLYGLLTLFIGLSFYNIALTKNPGYFTGVYCLMAIILTIVILSVFFIEKSRLKNFLLVCISCLTVVLFFEIILRLDRRNLSYFEKRFGYFRSAYDERIVENSNFYKPNSQHELKSPEFNYHRKTNSLGLPDDEVIEKSDSSQILIIGLGDSFTECDGAHQDSTWLKFLQRKLNILSPEQFIFINAGVCGSDPFYSYKLLHDKLLLYKPDIVFLTIGYDLEDVILRGGMERFNKKTLNLKPPKWLFFYSHSFIFRKIISMRFSDNYLFLSLNQFEQASQVAIKKLKYLILDFKQLGEKNHFLPIIIFYPKKEEIFENSYKNWNTLIEFCKENNVLYVDLLKYYRNVVGMNENNIFEYYWVFDGHHKAKGYEKFAEGILWSLKNDSIDIFSRPPRVL